MDFVGKVVLVSGGTSGIGRATVEAFVREGAIVGVNHLGERGFFTQMKIALKDEPGSLQELETDLRDSMAVNQMVDDFVAHTGKLDIVVNNAGISQVKPFLQVTDEDWQTIIDTDLKSVFLLCRAAIPRMLARGGAIVNVASELAFSGRVNLAPYTAAKGGVVSLTRSLALEFAPKIRINAVAPGPTRTPMLEKENAVPGHHESTEDIPLGRYAEAAEIAQAILFLASEKASYFCGDIVSPNGGTVMR